MYAWYATDIHVLGQQARSITPHVILGHTVSLAPQLILLKSLSTLAGTHGLYRLSSYLEVRIFWHNASCLKPKSELYDIYCKQSNVFAS